MGIRNVTDNEKEFNDEANKLEVPELPQRILSTYARLWQFETWLRRMAYIELRADKGDDWSKQLSGFQKPYAADVNLNHMPTQERGPLSYTQFSALRKVISENWDLFGCYFPPKAIWEAKLEEITQIRNRVAHFRKGHTDDLQRVLQMLRDIDRGFWTFCTSYNKSTPVLPQSDDSVTMEFLEHDPFPWNDVGDNRWARIGSAPRDMVLAVQIETLRRSWAKAGSTVDGAAGYLYDIHISARQQRTFRYGYFLTATQNIHDHLVHICLDSNAGSVRLTIPAVLGGNKIIGILKQVLEVTRYAIIPGGAMPHDRVERVLEQWPEYVIGPDNPLTFLCPDMPCSFFGV